MSLFIAHSKVDMLQPMALIKSTAVPSRKNGAGYMEKETERIATVVPVEEVDAAGLVAEIYTDIKRVKGIKFIPNFWKVLAVYPPQLEQVWNQLKAIMHPEESGREGLLSPQTREMIAVAVSASNGCSYCVNSHTAALKKLGVSQEAIAEGLAVAGLFSQTNALANGFQIKSDVFPNFE
jgi:AhpD family alkylhydroperoxidase